MDRQIRVVHKRPGFLAEVVFVGNDLHSLQGLLDGGYLCGIRLSPTVTGYVDDDGLLKELPLNFLLNGEPIVGPAIFSRCDGEGEEIGFENEDEALTICSKLNGDAR